MNIKTIEDALRDYKRKRSVIETTLLRVESFKAAIKDPESYSAVLLGSSRELGMPRGTNGGGSSVEIAIEDKEKSIELLREWIKDDLSRIYPLQIEIEQLNGALNALTKQERFIIESKYFEKMFWNDIEIGFNNQFRQKNYITYEQLKKINRDILNLLSGILKPYYNRFKVS